MNCKEVLGLLQDYATRELDPEPRRLVDEHLAGCGDCRQELALTALVVSGLDRQPVFEPRPDFSARVLAALPARQRSLHPAWALVLLPVLGGLAWLFRGELAGRVLGLLARLVTWLPETGVWDAARSFQFTSSTLLLVAGSALALGLGAMAAAAWYCWAGYCAE